MATLLAATSLGVTLVPASMGNVEFGHPSDDRTFEIATDPMLPLALMKTGRPGTHRDGYERTFELKSKSGR
jgi:hypothetical protein